MVINDFAARSEPDASVRRNGTLHRRDPERPAVHAESLVQFAAGMTGSADVLS